MGKVSNKLSNDDIVKLLGSGSLIKKYNKTYDKTIEIDGVYFRGKGLKSTPLQITDFLGYIYKCFGIDGVDLFIYEDDNSGTIVVSYGFENPLVHIDSSDYSVSIVSKEKFKGDKDILLAKYIKMLRVLMKSGLPIKGIFISLGDNRAVVMGERKEYTCYIGFREAVTVGGYRDDLGEICGFMHSPNEYIVGILV